MGRRRIALATTWEDEKPWSWLNGTKWSGPQIGCKSDRKEIGSTFLGRKARESFTASEKKRKNLCSTSQGGGGERKIRINFVDGDGIVM